MRDPDAAQRRLDATQARLWREAPAAVAAVYDAMVLGSADGGDRREGGAHGLQAQQMRALRRPLPTRDRRGLTLAEVAAVAGLDRETLAVLMEHHGYLELVPYGGRQRRRLVTDRAFAAELGHNADGSTRRVGVVEGHNRACPFPVFYPDQVGAILWTLDHAGIITGAAAVAGKRARLAWLLRCHGYLPTAELAALSGATRRGVELAWKRVMAREQGKDAGAVPRFRGRAA